MIKKLDWDTVFFGVKCGKATLDKPLGDIQQAELLDELKQYDFVSAVNIGCGAENALFLGNRTNGFLADVTVHFTKKVGEVTPSQDVTVTEGLQYDETLVRMSSFEHSKFFADKKLCARGGGKVYEQWLANAFGKKGNFFAVVENKGYCLFSFDGVCNIELIRVDESTRGQGIGKKLFAAVEKTACDMGYDTISVGTQLTNTSAINFYTACGARLERADAVYHIWNI